MVNKIVKILKKTVVKILKRPGEPDCTHTNISKIKKYLQWGVKIKIEEGIKDLLNNIDYWKNVVIWNKKSIKVVTKSWFRYLKK